MVIDQVQSQVFTAAPYNILAAGGDQIIGIIFFLIWVVVLVVSGLQKLGEAKRKREATMRRQMPTTPQPAQQPQHPSRPAPQRAQLPPRLPQPEHRPQPQARPKVPQLPKPAATTMPIPTPAPALVSAPDTRDFSAGAASERAFQAEIGSAEQHKARAAKPIVTARQIAKGLRPESFRKLYILTELLQPPIALRQDRLQH